MIEALSGIQKNGVSAFSTGSGGGAAISSATFNVAPAQRDSYTVNVADGAVELASKIMCWLAPNADFDADDLSELSVIAVPNTGSVDFTICSTCGAIVGDFLIYYMVG